MGINKNLLVIGLALALGVGHAADTIPCDRGDRDWERESFGLTLPVPAALDLRLLPASLVKTNMVGPHQMVADLVRGDFAKVAAHWDAIAVIQNPTDQMRAVVRHLDTLQNRGLYLLNQAQTWHAREPKSPAAALMLAAAWAHAGKETAWENYDRLTSPSHFFRLLDRMSASARLLDPLLERKDLWGRAARELNLSVRFHLEPSGRAKAWEQYLTLMDFAPHYEWLYLRAADYGQQRYSGGQSAARLVQLVTMAESRALPPMHLAALKQHMGALANPPEKMPDPQTWRPYWEARVKAAPTLNNLVGWLSAEYAVSNWKAIIEISDRVIAINPHSRYAWEQRSWALQQRGQLKEAYEASVVAITLGSDNAMNRVVQGFARGEMGLPQGDHAALLAHCRLGALAALGSAANCLGASHSEGFGGVRRDDRAALGWHVLGARGGHYNSQHDVAVLLPRVVSDPSLSKSVEWATGHWLRRAVAQNHRVARNKLDAQPALGLVCEPPPSGAPVEVPGRQGNRA